MSRLNPIISHELTSDQYYLENCNPRLRVYGLHNDPYLNRWTQPDTYVPESQGTQAFDRYAYVNNAPINFNDPTGHDVGCGGSDGSACYAYGLRTPLIVGRDSWGAKEPGSVKPSRNAEMSEGFFSENNSDGYAPYSSLLPGVSLSEILNTAVIHHEGDDATYDVRRLQFIEMENGYYDIPYHYVIGMNGEIYEGRNIGVRGAHVKGGNTGKIGIIWLGDFNPGYDPKKPGQTDPRDDTPTLAQYYSTRYLIHWLNNKFGIAQIGGHSDFNNTSCPGANATPFVNRLKQ